MLRGSVTVKKCLARPINVLWSQRGSLMFMEVEISAAMVVLRSVRQQQSNNKITGFETSWERIKYKYFDVLQ